MVKYEKASIENLPIGFIVDLESDTEIVDGKSYKVVALKAMNLRDFSLRDISCDEDANIMCAKILKSEYSGLKIYRIEDRVYLYVNSVTHIPLMGFSVRVYSTSGDLLHSFGELVYRFSLDYNLNLDVDLEKWEIKADFEPSLFSDKEDIEDRYIFSVIFDGSTLFSEVSQIMDTISNHLLKLGDTYFITRCDGDTVIVPNDCKMLVFIGRVIRIDSLTIPVATESIETIPSCKVSCNNLYISKDIKLSVLVKLISAFISEKLVFLKYKSDIEHLLAFCSRKNYGAFWAYLKANKKVSDYLFKDLNVFVY